CGEAKVHLAEATALATEITKLMATLPIKKARDQTDPLIDRRDSLLRQTLSVAESAINRLPRASVESISSVPPEAAEIDVVVFDQPTDPLDRSIEVGEPLESIIDVPVGEISEPYDPEATFPPPP